ncbi:MAG: hypothetical protein GC153_13075 [Alphaproteobacteria bacterium]|nr:hypothetical protein [Alphaproteobacteria bacterium]
MTNPNASFSSTSLAVDALIADGGNLLHKQVTIPSGTAALSRGTLLGAITIGALTQAFAGDGDGVLSALAAKKSTEVGDYLVTCTAAATNGGTFSVVTPSGNRLDDAVVGTAYANDHLAFSIADGATDFSVGDQFTLSVAAGSGDYIESVAAAVDGSQNPVAILAEDADASAADVTTLVYTAGSFLASEITFGTGHTAASVKDTLHALSIFLK